MNRTAYAPRWWVPGDWNGFFGLFTNVVLNVIVLTGLCLHVVNLPADIVYGRILPALGIALPLGNLYYAYLAWRLASSEGRDDVTAMPYGPSVPHMFIVVFLIMLPIYLKTHDPLLAWRSGLVWCLVIGAIVLLGAFVGPTVRKYTPRAAMLGTLAGISIAFISMRPAFLGWEDPWLFMLSLAIVLVSWMAGVRLPYGLPGGLVAVVLGTALAWLAKLVHLDELMQPADVVVRLRSVRVASALSVDRLRQGARRHRTVAGHRRAARHLQFHRGHEQCRERGGRRRRLQPAPDSVGRRDRRHRRRAARQPVPAGGLYRPSRMEGGRRPDRLFAGDRRGDRCRMLSRPDRAPAGGHSAGRDPADPALYRSRHRRTGVPGNAAAACAGDYPGDPAEHRRLGPDHDRRRARRRRHFGGQDRHGQARPLPVSSITAWRCSAAARCSPA